MKDIGAMEKWNEGPDKPGIPVSQCSGTPLK
jgi:hypothetical protein